MNRRLVVLLILALVLLAGVLLAGTYALRSGVIATVEPGETAQTTNLALDVRFDYSLGELVPAPFDDRAEYPLRLDAPDWSFYGKRIQGLGEMLVKEPGALLYDFIGSQHVESFVDWFHLVPEGEPVYEDVYIKGELALHQQLVYRRTDRSRGWPVYFPDSVTGGNEDAKPRSIKEIRRNARIADRLAVNSGETTAYIEGWAFFSDSDLFLFQAVSAKPLTPGRRELCMSIMDSMEFDVLVDLGQSKDKTGPVVEDEREPATVDPQDSAAPADPQPAPGTDTSPR